MRNRWLLVLTVMLCVVGFAAANIVHNGGLETQTPNFWSEGSTGGDLIWASDQAYMGARSLKITKTGTGTAASWMSANQAQTYWNHMEAVLYTIGGYMMTEGVNTDPATQDDMIGLLFTFKNEAGSNIVDPVFIAVDQSTANSDWAEYTTDVLLTEVPDDVTCEAMMGSGATGTVWFDNFMLGSDPWTAGFFGADVENPDGWMAWSTDHGTAISTGDTWAYSGEYCVQLEENDGEDDEMVFYSVPAAAEPNTYYLVSVMVRQNWVNTYDKFAPTAVMSGEGSYQNMRGNLCFFFHTGDIEHSWDLTGGDQFIYFDQREGYPDGWTMYWGLVKSPENATGFSMRARLNNYARGKFFYDNFSCVPVELGENLLTNGDLETAMPNFWSYGSRGGQLTWTTDDAYQGFRSLKISKTGTGTAASWVSTDQSHKYWNNMDAVLYTVGGHIKTMGANTEPATQDDMIGLLFTFKNASGANIVDPVFIAANQTTADTDWTEYTTDVLLTEVPEDVTCEAIMGSGATGTVWFDGFILGSDPWTAGFFGSGAEEPVNWMSWYATGDDPGLAYYQWVGAEEAHSGGYVAKMIELDGAGDEMVFYSEPEPLEAGAMYMFSTYTKSVGLAPLSPHNLPSHVMNGEGSYITDRANLCFFYHTGNIGTGWDLVGGDQFIYTQQIEADEEWTQYCGVAIAPEGATGASLRARFNNTVHGVMWFDDFEIRQLLNDELAVEESPFAVGQNGPMPSTIELNQNYPNPFNSTTRISYNVAKTGLIKLEVYDILGRKVATLVNEEQAIGEHSVSFNISDYGMFSSGHYFYRLQTPQGAVIRKMTYMK